MAYPKHHNMSEYKEGKTYIIERTNVLILKVHESILNEPRANEGSEMVLANK